MPKPTTEFRPAKLAGATFAAASFRKPEPPPEIEYTGDPEEDSVRELSAVEAGFIERAKAEAKRREKATDSEYWVCLCFQSRAEVESFLRETRWGRESDKYIDGRKVADALGVKIERDTTPYGKVRIDRKLADLSMNLGVSGSK